MTGAAERDRPAPAEPDWERLRAEFPVFERWVHLEIANKAPVGRFVDRTIAEFVDDSRETGGAEAFSRDRVEVARAAIARLVGARPETIAFAGNTSHALNFAAGGLDLEPGDNVLLAANEHPSNVFAWRYLEAEGVEVRWVPSRRSPRPWTRARGSLPFPGSATSSATGRTRASSPRPAAGAAWSR